MKINCCTMSLTTVKLFYVPSRETHLIIKLLIVVAHLYFECNTCTTGNGVKKFLTKRIH